MLVVDDQPLMRTGFRMVLAAEPDIEVVGEAGDGEEAVRLAAPCPCDVALTDIRMPRMDGIEATRRLAGEQARDPVRVVAAGGALLAPSVTGRLLDRFAATLPDPTAGRPPWTA